MYAIIKKNCLQNATESDMSIPLSKIHSINILYQSALDLSCLVATKGDCTKQHLKFVENIILLRD
jgi:hypothetical protein